jgi:hypothetical protein
VKEMTFSFMKYLCHTSKNLTAWGRWPYFSPKEVLLQIFIALKRPLLSAGFQPADVGSVASMLTITPLRMTI